MCNKIDYWRKGQSLIVTNKDTRESKKAVFVEFTVRNGTYGLPLQAIVVRYRNGRKETILSNPAFVTIRGNHIWGNSMTIGFGKVSDD